MALTYDAPQLQQQFIDKFAITYPLVSDVDATSIKNLGILDTQYAPGDSNYGIPHPGVFIVTPKRIVAGKIFIEGYDTRVDADGVLKYAEEVLPLDQ